jgi:hypothetical protein
MFCLQPAVIGAAEFCKWSEFDHGMFPVIEFPLAFGYALPDVL